MGSFLSAIPGAVAQGLIWGIMAIGVYITFRVLDFADLTVDGTMATGGAIFVMTLTVTKNIPLAFLLAFIGGCLAGLVTGVLNTILGIPPILAGILTQLALYSVNLRILGKANQALSIYEFPNLPVSLTKISQSLIVVAIITVIIVAILYWFFDTELGHSVRATGSNQDMSRANGINVNFTKIIALVLSNGIVALSGALLSQYQGFADINMGRGAIVVGLAAVIIGEVVFGKIFKNFALKLIGVAIGGVIYYIVMQLVISLGLRTDDLKLLTATIVALFLGIPYLKSKYDQTHIKNKEVKA